MVAPDSLVDLRTGAGYARGPLRQVCHAVPEGGTPEGWDAWFANDGGTYFDPAFWAKNVPGVPGGRTMEGLFDAIIGNASVAFLERELAAARRVLLYVAPKAVAGCVEINQCVGCKQAWRRWRGGRHGDSGRTRRKFDFHIGARTIPPGAVARGRLG